ncbi:PREDICTED: uncharacterized protein LOC101619398 [Condylura cristata]|uniref:uncharacterized protein LOC101619398 n=1 Tax=Condylura cristata TaxID=143302 RepID=UPI0006435A79|nr:PREDICTED: uncharacterized protein LOC101619398 [Condylura cristata]
MVFGARDVHRGAKGACAAAKGACATAKGACATAKGACATAKGACATAKGACATAKGACATAKGACATAKGACATAKGARAPAEGTEDKNAMQKRAEERAKVPGKFRDSIKHYFFTPTGFLKILRLGLLIGALICFIAAEAHESYIAITVLEICIVLFFILIYMLTLHHLLICLDWSLLDLINSFITAVFLILVGAVAMQELNRRHLYSTGGILCLTAAFLCLIDSILVTKNLRLKVKKVLGLKSQEMPSAETGKVGLLEAKLAEATPVVSRATTPIGSVVSKVSTAPPSRASSAAPSRASTPAASRATSQEATPVTSVPPSRTPSQAPSRGPRGPPGQV